MTRATSAEQDSSDVYQEEILNYLRKLEDLDEEATVYSNNGEFRTVQPLSEDEIDAAERLQREYDMEPKQCYWNCQRVLLHEPEDKYTYVEGYTMSHSVPVPIQHAWLEMDDTVLEVTFPDGPGPRDGATYFGVPYSADKIRTRLSQIKSCWPMASTV